MTLSRTLSSCTTNSGLSFCMKCPDPGLGEVNLWRCRAAMQFHGSVLQLGRGIKTQSLSWQCCCLGIECREHIQDALVQTGERLLPDGISHKYWWDITKAVYHVLSKDLDYELVQSWPWPGSSAARSQGSRSVCPCPKRSYVNIAGM